jgi:hypothetical protein
LHAPSKPGAGERAFGKPAKSASLSSFDAAAA